VAQPEIRRATVGTWLGGLIADLVLYLLFLATGLTVLNVFIQAIVLVVGLFQNQEAAAFVSQGMGEVSAQQGETTGRLSEDLAGLGLAVLAAAASIGAYWGYLWLRRKYLHLFMGTGFESFVSKRYLIAREGGRLVGLITVVSVLGVAVGVMALIVVISVMEGFDRELVKKFMGVFSHIQVQTNPRYIDDPAIPEDVYMSLIEQFSEKEYVEGVAPIIEFETIVQRSPGDLDNPAFVMLRGLDPERERTVTRFLDYVEMGKAEPADGEVVIGEQLMRQMQIVPGDTIYAVGKTVQTANRMAVKRKPLEVVGVFHSGLYDVDQRFIYTNLETLQDLRGIGNAVTSVHVKVDNPQRVNEYAHDMLEVLPEGYGIRTWQMMNREFFEALWMEKVAMFIILLLIVLVAALNIIGTLVMTVVQKTRDIGVLKSMGATNGMVLRIFLYHGFLIGLMGTSLGVVWGLRLCHFVHTDIEKIFRLPGGVYGLDRLPVVVDPWLIAFMAGASMVICIVASIIPAYQAARLNPVEALRYD